MSLAFSICHWSRTCPRFFICPGSPQSTGPSGCDVSPALQRSPASLEPHSIPGNHPPPDAFQPGPTRVLAHLDRDPLPRPQPDLEPHSHPRPTTAAPMVSSEGVQPLWLGAGVQTLGQPPGATATAPGPTSASPSQKRVCPQIPPSNTWRKASRCPHLIPSGPLQIIAQRPKSTTKELQLAVCPLLRNARGPGLFPKPLVASCLRLSTYWAFN